MKKGFLNASQAREKKIAPPLKVYLRRGDAVAGTKEHPPTTTVSLASRLAAFEKHVSDLDAKFTILRDHMDEVDLLLENLFPEGDSEETEEMEESDR